MVLKTKVKLSQSKKAWTQYITVPSAVVQDSQYPFKENEELNLLVEPTMGMIIISRKEEKIKITNEGLLITKIIEKQPIEIDAR